MKNQIFIHDLQVHTRIGITEEERATPQKLLVSLTITPTQPFTNLEDNIHLTVDYAKVAEDITTLAANSILNLIETLATRITDHILTHFPAQSVTVEIQKFILPNTRCVGVVYTASVPIADNSTDEK